MYLVELFSEECLLNVFLVFTDIFSPLVTNPAAVIFTGMTKVMFHIPWISNTQLLYFNFFSDNFCIIFLSNGIATAISKQILSSLLLITLSGLFSRTSLSVCLYSLIPLHLYTHVLF